MEIRSKQTHAFKFNDVTYVKAYITDVVYCSIIVASRTDCASIFQKIVIARSSLN